MPLKLPTHSRRAIRLSLISLALCGYVAASAVLLEAAGLPSHAYEKGCHVQDDWFWCDGEKFFVKGIGWDPTRPGEVPWKSNRDLELVRSDFAAIRAAGFNTLRTWESLTAEELEIAKEHGLRVLQGIWIDPAGDFSDPAFLASQSEKVRRVVSYSAQSSAILGYLIMNEPEPGHVIEQGIDTSRQFLEAIANVIRSESPGAAVSFASWPGLEFFEVPELDFVAVNLHPFRPHVLLDAVGYAGVVRIWKERQAKARPLVITEFGISVSPTQPNRNQPGGKSEVEQARRMPELADAIAAEGASGSAAFMWIDGWWKNADGDKDAQTHDPSDGEEWFGLNAMERIGDRIGRPRPVLDAMKRWNRAVLVEPGTGVAPSGADAIEIYVEEELAEPELFVSIDGDVPLEIAVRTRGNWLQAQIPWPQRAREARIRLLDRGRLIGEWRRDLRANVEARTISVHVERDKDQAFAVAVVRDENGATLPETAVQLAVFDASHEFDRSSRIMTNAEGAVRLGIELPAAPARALVVAALMVDEDTAPALLDSVIVGGESER